MSTDDRILDLIHAEIDGAASPEERAVLREDLDTRPEARLLQSDFAKLAEVLKRVDPIDPPEDLKRSIMAALQSPTSVVGGAAHHNNNRRRQFGFSALKYGYALAAGLLLGLVLGRVAFRNAPVPEPSDLLGTMTARARVVQNGPSDRIQLDLPDLRGSAALTRSNSDVLIRFDLIASSQAEVVVSFAGGQHAFRGFDQESPNVRAFEVSQDRITFAIEGEHRSILLLTERSNAEVIIDMKFIISGRLVQSGTLRLPRTG